MEEILKKQTQQAWFELLQKYPKAKEKALDPNKLGELVDDLYEMDQDLWDLWPIEKRPTKETYRLWLEEVVKLLQ